MNIIFGTTNSLRGHLPNEDFSLSLAAAPGVVASAGTITPTIKDLTYSAVTATGMVLKSDIVAINGAANSQLTYASLTPDVCTVGADGRVGYVSPGECRVQVAGRTGRRVVSQTVSISGGGTVYSAVIGFAAGSLRTYLRDQQLAALSGVAPGSAAQRAHAVSYAGGMSGNGGSVNTGNFIRSQNKPGFDALPLDALDEMLVGNDGTTQWRAWVSPHHYLTWRGHGSSSVAGQYVAIGGEIVVAYSATPWAGTLCKLLPSNWRNYLPDSLVGAGSISELALWTRHFNTYLAGDTRWVMPAMHRNGVYAVEDARRVYQRTTLDSAGNAVMSTGGDSGSPAFVGIREPGQSIATLVPLGHTAYATMMTSWWYGDNRSEIDAAMALLNASGAYSAGTVDLSGFTSYP